MAKHKLSKSTFIRGLQCHKSLYLYKKRYFLRDRLSPEQLAKFKRGTNVGLLARELFPGGTDASPPTHFQYAKAVEQTHDLIAQQFPVIYEASFSHNGVLVALDILQHRDGKWYAYEVKSSLAISETYLNDAAMQYHVILGNRIELADISIIYMNKDYVLQGDLDLSKLFLTQSVIDEARSRQPLIEEEIAAQLKVVELPKSPPIDIGPHCNKPYPCDFQGHCWKHIPKNSIFELQWLSEEQKFELYSKMILQVEDIPDDFLSDPVQKMKLQAHKTSTPFIDKEFIRRSIEKIEYPVCFLKVWYHRPAVPLYEGTRPYEKLPFFISVGIKQDMNTSLTIRHHFFEPATNPFPAFLQILNETAAANHIIFTFNDPFTRQFYTLHSGNPENGNQLQFFDLHDVLAVNHLYDPKIMGDTSLSNIASAILNVQKATDKNVFNSETIALLAYTSSQGSESDAANFQRSMQQTSSLHLEWLEGFYSFLAAS